MLLGEKMAHDCTQAGESIHVINSPYIGPIYRCNNCGYYWAYESERLWESADKEEAINEGFEIEEIDESQANHWPNGMVPIFFGKHEQGLACIVTAHSNITDGDTLLNAVYNE